MAFYRALGLDIAARSRADQWAELRLGDALLALHQTEQLPEATRRVELCFVSTEPLETLVARFTAAGTPLARPITDEAFGRSLVVQDPDGLRIQINEQDPELYT